MLRRYSSADYSTIKLWADARKFPLLPEEFLPLTGFIHEGYCVAFLYRTDSKIAWMEWVISNPSTEKVERQDAMNEMIKAIGNEARSLGFKVIFTAAGNEGLIERYKTLGFTVTDTNATHLIGWVG